MDGSKCGIIQLHSTESLAVQLGQCDENESFMVLQDERNTWLGLVVRVYRVGALCFIRD